MSLWSKLEEMEIYSMVESDLETSSATMESEVPPIERHSDNVKEQYENVKLLLRSEGFEVLQDYPISNTLYVVGSKLLKRELDFILPDNTQITFHENGLDVSENIPVWSISVK